MQPGFTRARIIAFEKGASLAGLLYKSSPAEFKVDSTSNDWVVEGYASTFDLDEGRDQIHPGSFKKTIRERFKKKGAIKVLWEHFDPMGLPVDMFEDETGLYTKSRVSKTETNRERLTLMEDGVVDRMSIGYQVPKGKSQIKDDVRHIKEVSLFEYSMVLFPMNEAAAVQSVHKHAEFARMLKDVDRDAVIAYAKTFEGADIGRIENAMDALIELTSNIPTLTKDEEPSHEDTPAPDEPSDDDDQDPEEKALADMLQSWREDLQLERQLHDARRAI